MKEIAIDFETIQDPVAVPFIPEKGPRDRTDPWEKLCFDSNYIHPCVAGFCDGVSSWSIGIDEVESEAELLASVWQILSDYDRYVTFNGLGFDIPLLLKRSWYHGVKPSVSISLKKYDAIFTNHIDVRAILGNWDSYARGNLDLYGALKLGERKTDGIDGGRVQGLWDAGEYIKVHEYCRRDAKITWDLYQSLKGYYLPEDMDGGAA